jgi:hypothetical protein
MPASKKQQWVFRARSYSLNEAAGIRRQYVQGSHAPECPRCDTPLKLFDGGNAQESFVLAACACCGVSVMVALPGDVLAGAGTS